MSCARHFLDLRDLGRHDWWRYLLGFVLIAANFELALLFLLDMGHLWVVTWGAAEPVLDWLFADGLLNEFAGAFLVQPYDILMVALVLTAFHRRPLRTVITAQRRVAWRLAARATALWMVIFALDLAVFYPLDPGGFSLTFEPRRFALFTALALIAVPVQATGEEITFRGYLMQALAGITRRPVALAVVNGLLFAVPHFLNPEMERGFVPMALSYASFGVLAALLTLRTGGIEAAAGMHTINNILCFTVVTTPDAVVTSPAIFEVVPSGPWLSLGVGIVEMTVFWLLFFGRRSFSLAELPGVWWQPPARLLRARPGRSGPAVAQPVVPSPAGWQLAWYPCWRWGPLQQAWYPSWDYGWYPVHPRVAWTAGGGAGGLPPPAPPPPAAPGPPPEPVDRGGGPG